MSWGLVVTCTSIDEVLHTAGVCRSLAEVADEQELLMPLRRR